MEEIKLPNIQTSAENYFGIIIDRLFDRDIINNLKNSIKVENMKLPLMFKEDIERTITILLKSFNLNIYAKITKAIIENDYILVDLEPLKYEEWFNEWKW